MIKVKFAEANNGVHGVVQEMMLNPPEGIDYSHFDSDNIKKEIITIPTIKEDEADIIEAFDTAIITDKNWIYTGSDFPQIVSFDLSGSYPNRQTRLDIIEKLLEKDNCKKLIFPSNAGLNTIHTYGNINNKKILDKCTVIPYAFRKIDDKLTIHKEKEKISLLFIGSQFVRKGGKQLVEAFKILNRKYDVELNIVSNFAAWEKFTSEKDTLEIKNTISKTDNINILPTDRESVLNNYYPNADILVFPTLWETYGFVPVEAMAYGLPVVSTDWHSALPEIIEDNISGFLIKIMQTDFMKAVKNNENKFNSAGFYQPPEEFNKYLVDELVNKLSLLIEDPNLRKKIGREGLNIARTKFSFEERNKTMKNIYEESIH